MMKRSIFILFTVLSCLVVTSCRDTPDKLRDDYQSLYEETCEILEYLNEGKISSAQAVKALKDYETDFQKLLDRRAKLEESGKLTEGSEEYEELSRSLLPVYRRLIALIRDIHAKGKFTPELSEVLNYEI